MTRTTLLIRICSACIIAFMAGCKQDSSTPVEAVQTSHLMYQPKGTITGLINNLATKAPIAGAVFSLGFDGGVQSTTSDGAGAFSFANVPVGQYEIVNGTRVTSGIYTLTVSLVDYNASQSDPAKKYRNYYYSTVTIKFTSLAPGDSLAVSDMVGSVLLQISYLNTTVTGQVVDQKMQPVADAVVTLFDATVFPNAALAQTKTSANGVYQFTRVDNGLTIMIKAVSSDGSLEGTLPFTLTLPANVTADSLRSQVTAERIMITPVDNVNPFVIGITPENNSDVNLNTLIVYTFSEPIKQTAYTKTDLPPGHNTIIDDIIITYVGLKKAAATIPFSAQWNSTFTQLTITPQGVIGSARYNADLRTAFNSGKITDLASKTLANNTTITGDFEVLQFTTSGGSTVPAAPSLTRRIVAGLFTDLNFSGGVVGLEWNYDNNARSYNIYRSVNNGSFDLLQKDYYGVQLTDNATGLLVVPSSATNPLTSASVRYLVRGVSKDLVESASSNIITVTDVVKPQLVNATVASAGSANTWLYTLRFSEPMTVSTAKNTGNYSFSNTGTVTFTVNSASYLGFSAGQYTVQLTASTSAPLPVGYVLRVEIGATDLAGNGMDTAANSKTF